MAWPSWNVESNDRRRASCACSPRPLPTTLLLVSYGVARRLATTILLHLCAKSILYSGVLFWFRNGAKNLLWRRALSVGMVHGDREITGTAVARRPLRLSYTVHTELAKLRIQKRSRDGPRGDKSPSHHIHRFQCSPRI
jgi:hypothetical protein